MGLTLNRALHSAYELIGTEKLNRLAKGTWNGAAALAWGLLGAPESGMFWFGDAGKPGAGAGLATTLAAGLGVVVATGTGDFDHALRPLIIPTSATLPHDANNDPNGWDRVDAICIRAIEAEGESANASIRDPLTGNVTIAARNQRVTLTYQYAIVKGAPALSPAIPSAPAGYVRIGYVIIRNAAGSVNSADVYDERTPASLSLGSLLLTRSPWLRLGSGPTGAILHYAPETEGALNAGDVAVTTGAWDGVSDPDGVLRVGTLHAGEINAPGVTFAHAVILGGFGLIGGSKNIASVSVEPGNVYRFNYSTPAPDTKPQVILGSTNNSANNHFRVVTNANENYFEVQVLDNSHAAVALTGDLMVAVFLLG